MTLQEAFQSCREGNIVSHKYFDTSQCMLYFNGSFYYEDGTCLEAHMGWLEQQEWAQTDWYIKYSVRDVNPEIPAQILEIIKKRSLVYEKRNQINAH